jgi:hypothetical protein
MNSFTFWKSWNKSYQVLFWMLAVSVTFFIAFLWYARFQAPAPAITWEQWQQLSVEESLLHSFSKGIFEIPVYGDNFLIYEVMAGSDLQPPASTNYFFLFASVVSVILLLAIISTLSRYWFIIAMGLFCLFFMTLQIDALQVFGYSGKAPAIAMLILFCGVAFYYHALRVQATLLERVAVFTCLYSLLLLMVGLFAHVPDPFLIFSVNHFGLAIIITLIFILMTGHEIPAAFITLLTKSNRQEKSLRHFLVIFGFYFLNLLLSYGIKIGYIHLSIWTIDFYLLFTISAILGIWGFRQREPLYESFFPANPTGTYFVLAFALIAFASIGFFIVNAHDTVLIVIRDMIIYSHLGYGIIFLFYVISNFGSMLSQNLQVYRVLYKPNTMPYFTFRLMGLICTFAFLVFDTNWRTPIKQVFATYYNMYGDIFLRQGEHEQAQTWYKRSVFYRNQNHHAHYALADLYGYQLNGKDELAEWKAAGESQPLAQTVINLTDALRSKDQNTEAIFAIERALHRKKDNGALLNAKGLIYAQLNMADSSLQSFQKARQSANLKQKAETNLLAASARFKITYPADSLLRLLGSENEGARANTLALATQQNHPIEMDYRANADTILTLTRAVFMCNYFLNQRTNVDTLLLHHGIELARKPVNESFKEYLLITAAQAYYSQGRVKLAFELAREVAYGTAKGKYFTLLASWALEQDNAAVAADYFAIAKEKQQPNALLNEALALTEANQLSDAWPLWDSLTKSNEPIASEKIQKLKNVLSSSQGEIRTADDESKYLFCRYRLPLSDSIAFGNISNSIADEELKIRALLEYASKWYDVDEPEIAARYVNKAEGLKPVRERTLAHYYYLRALLVAQSKDWNELAQMTRANDLLKQYYRNAPIYFEALMDEAANNLTEAEKKFDYLGRANVYFEDGLIASARFFTEHGNDPLRPYSIIVSGLLAKPHSVKLLKAYIKQSALIGFDKEAETSLEKLKQLIPRASFNKYLKENPDFFDLE